jgi:hypothetical protein
MKEIEYVRAYPIFYTSTLSIALENKISARVMLKVTVCCADDDDAGQAIAGVDFHIDDDAI